MAEEKTFLIEMAAYDFCLALDWFVYIDDSKENFQQ